MTHLSMDKSLLFTTVFSVFYIFTVNAENYTTCFPNSLDVNIGNKAAHVKYGNQNENNNELKQALASDLPSGLKIATWNIRSIYPNLDEIKEIFSNPKEADIVGFTESWLKDSLPDTLITIPQYKIAARADRKYTNGGGVILYTRENIPCEERLDLKQKDIEAVWAEIKFPNSTPLLVCTLYRPPDSCVDWFEQCSEMIDKAYSENKEMVIMGDLNIDWCRPHAIPTRWMSIIDAFNLNQIITGVTRTTETSNTCIDHIYVTRPENVRATKVAHIGLSDHFPVCFTRKKTYRDALNCHKTIKYRSCKNLDEAAFLSDLRNVPWSVCETFDDPNDALDCWYKLFMDIVDTHAPMKERRVKRLKQPDWFTDEIHDAIRERDKHAKHKNYENWRFWRNKVTNLIKKAKCDYYQSFIEANMSDSKKLWEILREISPNDKSAGPVTISEPDGELLTEPKDIADSFNDYFANISSSILQNMPAYNEYVNKDLEDFINAKTHINTTFEIPPVTEAYVLKQLQLLKDGKAVGLDGLSSRLLRIASPIIASPLTKLMNLSINTGLFPNDWKVAKVVPLHKKGSTNDRGNYRPVSVLPVLSKLLERHVHQCFYSFLVQHKLLHPAQSGFRHSFSCETALANLVNKWSEAIDKGLLNGVVLLDLRKAFDLINHKILLQKLKLYKCSDMAMQWFQSYLDGRAQCTAYRGCVSDKQQLTVGVPQGSILGPLFFIVFINDLPLCIENSHIDMYADDSSITTMAKSVPELNVKLNSDLNKISAWCTDNRMAANSSKTKSMLVTTWQKRNSLDENDRTLELYLQGNLLENTMNEKLLGVQINNNLSWDEHIHYTEKIINRKLALLNKIKSYLPLAARKLFYNTHILPHMDYASIVWGRSSFISRLLLLQKRAARSILNITDIHYPSERMFKELKWMPIQDRIDYRTVTMVYRSLNHLAPSYMTEMFQTTGQTNTRQTRSVTRNDLALPSGKHKNIFINSFAYSGAKLWNKLDLVTRNKPSLDSFKHSYLRQYFNNVLFDH